MDNLHYDVKMFITYANELTDNNIYNDCTV